jgi:threonine aldolase
VTDPEREHHFASDNHSGAHPDVLAAIAAANSGHADSYGEDAWTARLDDIFRRHFGPDAHGFCVFNGTAANVLAIDALTRPHEAVVCTATAHMNVDECGAPERIAGVKLLPVEGEHGKLAPERLTGLDGVDTRRGDQHASQPRILSISQATELGTVYSPDEVRALADWAHERGLLLHVDGARLANAAASLDRTLGEITTDLDVDVLSLGGTKNGLLLGDAVVFLRADLAHGFEFIRKQGMQLASKMRFLAVQLEALLDSDLWLSNARQANAMTSRLAAAVEPIDGVELVHPVEANAIFARLPRPAIDRLIVDLPGRNPFYIWDEAADVVRWMCSWDTTEDDVDRFAAAVADAVAAAG